MHAPVHRRTCIQHICTHTRSHAPSITEQIFCCFLCLSLPVFEKKKRKSKLLLFSFFFCKDGSDRLMKWASYSCCNFLCVVLAAAYLKYRWCRLSCLPFVWHFFHCDTHTHRPALDCFLHELNSFHPTISFTFSISDIDGVFLDARVYIKAVNWESDLYVKLTDRHQYLHQESCHPPHVTPAIP